LLRRARCEKYVMSLYYKDYPPSRASLIDTIARSIAGT
jgi:hypothetical protein